MNVILLRSNYRHGSTNRVAIFRVTRIRIKKNYMIFRGTLWRTAPQDGI